MRLAGFALALILAFPTALAEAQERVPESEAEITLSFAPVVRAAAPAVVSIYARRVVAERVSPFANDPLFRDFFRDFGQVVPRVQNALGSGVIVSRDGIVVSNYHVVGDATEIRAVLADRREFDAEVILSDAESDLAVLRLLGATDLPALPLRDSDAVEVGELVLAIGNPFGMSQTVSSGIVSALARSGINVGSGRGYFIQTDAAINPGNSGGALVDMRGRLVGINTAILSRSGGSMGIGFAIPANLVRQVVAQAEAGESRFIRPWAGVVGQGVDAALADAFGMEMPKGVVLADLHPQSPLRAAGLQPGDVVLEVSGEAVNAPQEMMFRLSALGVGSETVMTYLRDGIPAEAVVPLGPAPEQPARDTVTISANVALRGLTAENINPAVIVERGLPLMAEGVVVAEAVDLARRVGLREGDILVSINRMAIRDTDDLRHVSEDGARNWEIVYIRDGRQGALRFRI